MLLGETVGMGLVTYFAIVRYFGRYDLITPPDVIWMMWLVYLSGAFSTVALVAYVIKVSRQGTRRRKGDNPDKL